MTTTSPRESAKIYAFAPRDRAAATARKTGQHPSDNQTVPATVALCDFGGGWYHDSEIRDAATKQSQ